MKREKKIQTKGKIKEKIVVEFDDELEEGAKIESKRKTLAQKGPCTGFEVKNGYFYMWLASI